MRRSSSLARLVVVAAIALASLPFARAASAYCRTSVCDGKTAAVCTPAEDGDCGIPLYWPTPCVGFSLQSDASVGVSLEAATTVLEAAFRSWMDADCGSGTNPRIAIHDLGPVECDQHEYNQDQGNANIIVFRDGTWPYKGQGQTLALTTVTYNLDTGEIYDADMELNSAQTPFTTGDTGVQFDLLSIATHETGHFLGLAHSSVPGATMDTKYMKATTDLRDLSPDDIAGICAIYPPGEVPASCDPSPRHGFQSECAHEQTSKSSCCTVAPGTPAPRLGAAMSLALGALVFGARRGRRRPRAPSEMTPGG